MVSMHIFRFLPNVPFMLGLLTGLRFLMLPLRLFFLLPLPLSSFFLSAMSFSSITDVFNESLYVLGALDWRARAKFQGLGIRSA